MKIIKYKNYQDGWQGVDFLKKEARIRTIINHINIIKLIFIGGQLSANHQNISI